MQACYKKYQRAKSRRKNKTTDDQATSSYKHVQTSELLRMAENRGRNKITDDQEGTSRSYKHAEISGYRKSWRELQTTQEETKQQMINNQLHLTSKQKHQGTAKSTVEENCREQGKVET